MSSSRHSIFSRIDAATDALKTKTPLPDYDLEITQSPRKLTGDDLWEIFCRNLKAVNGKSMTSAADLADWLKQNNHLHGYCDPLLFDDVGSVLAAAGLTVDTEYDREQYDIYQFGITRASGAIAESGTIILDDHRTSRRLAALSPWVHVAVLEHRQIHRSIANALAALGDSPNVTWCTGPSKTADVEGILIEGVHGPGEQIALRI